MNLALDPKRTSLLVVDVQERLTVAMEPEAMARVRRYVPALLQAAPVLGLNVVVTEQYPKGLGPTIPEVLAALPGGIVPHPKNDFSCGRLPGVREQLRQQVIVVGLETHVCVYESARDLAASGKDVFVPHEAVASRLEENRRIGLSLVERAGGVVTSVETVLFDLLGRAGTPEFKSVSALLR